MKSLKSILIVLATFFVFASIHSCKDDTEVCQNGGVLVNGNCECLEGYQGSSCETEWRAKILGDYTVVQNCSWGDFGPHDFTFSADASNPLEMDIDGFEGTAAIHYDVIMTEETTFDIPSQTACAGCLPLEGSSSIDVSTGIITQNISFTNNNTCTFTYTR